jgi:glycosyltransferase involved in cell wall biosynthesis
MKLVFVTEARFTRDIQGNIYGESSFNSELWQRYLTTFSEVVVMARVQYDCNYIGNASHLSSANLVSFIELPYFIGPFQYLKKRKELFNKVNQSIEGNDAIFICRIPGNISNIVIKYLSKRKIPFGVEVVGDPWDVFAPGSIKHPLRFYFRWKGYFDLKRIISKASAVLYVTQNKLQKRYPANSTVFQTTASNVKIKDDLIVTEARKHVVKKQYVLLSIGSLEQMYKAPDIVLRAVKMLNDEGFGCKLIWLGDGVYKSSMKTFSKQLDVEKFVDFKGNVGSESVRNYLLQADIFVLVSRTEGLPRAIIEAMAVGLPCVGTNIGGIPELLEDKVLIVKDNFEALVDKIKKLILKADFYNERSSRNLIESTNYKESILLEKRIAFYRYLIRLKQE